jgi:hypothetical protein
VHALVLSVRGVAPFSAVITAAPLLLLLLTTATNYMATAPVSDAGLPQAAETQYSSIASRATLLLSSIPLAVRCWAVLECGFLCWHARRMIELQARTTPPSLSKAERRRLIERTMSASPDLRRFLSGFHGFAKPEEVWRGNAEEWAAMALFSLRLAELSSTQHAEVQDAVAAFEKRIEGQSKLCLRNGFNERLRGRAMLVSVDPIHATLHPAIHYAITYGAAGLGSVALRQLGFARLNVGALNYWHRPADSRLDDVPPGRTIVLLHGIGLGLTPYVIFLRKVLSQHSNCAILLPEFPHISQQCFEVTDPPSSEHTASAIRTMMERHASIADGDRVLGATFIAHSFGSVVFAWLLAAQHRSLGRDTPGLVDAVLFLDPVSVGLQEPDVCYNFLYKPIDLSSTAIEIFFKYFVAGELGIAHVLHRHFWWYKNTLWPEDIPSHLRNRERCKVLLGGADHVVNIDMVRNALKGEGLAPEVIVVPRLNHAEVVVNTAATTIALRMLSDLQSV